MRRWTVFGLLLLSLLLPRLAMADYPWTYFAVKCDSAHNRALIRFVVIDSGSVKMGSIIRSDQLITDKSDPGYDVPALPAALNARWQGIPYRNETGCTLQNGQTITLEQEGGPEGQGWQQGVADVAFTMKIDSHFVFFHYPFYSGFGPDASGLLLEAVEYAGGKLLLCKAPEKNHKGQVIHGPKCLNESKRLLPGEKYLTPIEKNALWVYRRRQKLKRALSPLCKAIFAGLDSGTTPKGFVFYFKKKHFLAGSALGGGIYYSSNIVSLYNNKSPGRAVEVGALYPESLNYYDQNFVFYFGKNHGSYHKFVDFLKKNAADQLDSSFPHGADARAFAPWRKFYIGVPRAWIFDHDAPLGADWIARSRIAIGIPRVSTIIGYRGIVYLFTMPNTFDPSGAVPAIIIRKLMPDKSEKLICTFPHMVTPDCRF